MNKRFHISKYKPSVLQGKFDFESVSKKRSAALAVEHPAERLMFTAFGALLVLLIAGYFYFIVGSVLNVIAGKEADAKSSQIQGEIAGLEEQYFALSQELTPEAAAALGLAPVGQTSYVDRPGNAAVASAPDHAI